MRLSHEEKEVVALTMVEDIIPPVMAVIMPEATGVRIAAGLTETLKQAIITATTNKMSGKLQ
jgi:hypothetical protein